MVYDFEIYNNPRKEDGTFKRFIVVYHTKSEDTDRLSDEMNAYFDTPEEVAIFLRQDRPKPLRPLIYQLVRGIVR